MPPSAARKTPAQQAASARRTRAVEPIVIYVGTSVDGTSFALDPSSQQLIREAFPDVQVSTRNIFIGHDTREDFERSVGRFEDQIAMLLTGVSARRLSERFRVVSFRDPRTSHELGQLRVQQEE